MHIKYCVSALTLALAGCAGTAHTNAQVSLYEQQFANSPPTREWLEQEEIRLTELVANSPSATNKAALNFIEQTMRDRRYNVFVGEQKLKDTHRSPTLVWGNTGRGGAAYRAPAHIHALGSDEPKEFRPTLTYNLNQATAHTFPVQPESANTGQGYSHYEMSRWERFCDNGKGMDKRDWAFVKKAGIHNVPASLLGRCNAPTRIP